MQRIEQTERYHCKVLMKQLCTAAPELYCTRDIGSNQISIRYVFKLCQMLSYLQTNMLHTNSSIIFQIQNLDFHIGYSTPIDL